MKTVISSHFHFIVGVFAEKKLHCSGSEFKYLAMDARLWTCI